MIRSIILASAIAFTGAAQAAPQLIGGGDNAQIVYDEPSANVVGGGTVRFSGGGVNRSFSYEGVQAVPGRAATLIGGGDDQQIVYAPTAPAPADATLAQTPALARPRG